MKKIVFTLMLLLAGLPAWTQTSTIQRPNIPLTGRIGPGGTFPILNGGSIAMADADYNFQNFDSSATTIILTGTLSTIRSVIATNATAQGFIYIIDNKTNQSIIFRGSATAAGVTIASGTVQMVMSDGTSYVPVGAATASSGPGAGTCAPGQFVTALTIGAAPTCDNPPTTYLSNLIAATKPNTIFNGIYQQAWAWHFGASSVNLSGLKLEEQDVGAGTGNSVVTISSFAGSPTTALTVNGNTQLTNLTVTGTCTGCGGGPTGPGPTFPVTTLTTTSTTPVTAADFQNHTTFVSTNASATPTIQLPTPAPPQGQYIWFINYVATQPAINRAGPETLNGAAVTMYVPSSVGGASPNAWRITSTGTNYIGAKVVSGSFNTLTSGILAGSQILTIGNTASMVVAAGGNLTAASTNTGNNGTINGTRWNSTLGTLNVVGNSTGTAGTLANVVASGSITADTSMSSPQFLTCTTANPCITPTSATLPAGRLAGGEPLATVHLADFSATPATNGQVPIWNGSLSRYVPGPQASGGTPSISDLTAATVARPFTGAINNGNRVQTWKWDFGAGGAGQNFGGLVLTEGTASTATTGNGGNYGTLLGITTLANSTTYPMVVYAGNNGWWNFSYNGQLQGVAGAKLFAPIILATVGNPGTPVADAAALGTDSGGNIIPVTPAGGGGALYVARHANVPLLSATGDLQLTGTSCNASGICTMVTPAGDGMYRMEGTLVLASSGGASCSPAGSIQLQVSWSDAETNVSPTNQAVAFRSNNLNTFVIAMAMTNFTGQGVIWSMVPHSMMVKQGTSATYKIAQTVASSGCTPTITANIRLFGPL